MNKIISFSTGSTALQSADEFADGFVAWWMKFRQIFEVLKEISEIRTVFVHDLWWIGVFMFFFVFFFLIFWNLKEYIHVFTIYSFCFDAIW